MGFGYNPNLTKYGERLDVLDYFSWMKRLRVLAINEWIVWDASGYYIVNRTPKKKIEALKENLSGEKVLEILVTEQDSPKRKEIMNNCDLRSQYLKRLIQISQIPTVYIDSRIIFREDSRYCNKLDIALEYVNKLKRDNPQLVNKIIPPNDNPAVELYLPLEIAEALYLEKYYQVSGKFGPETEEFFDTCILDLQEEREIPYTAVWSPLGPRRVGYLSDDNVIWTQSPDKFISKLLDEDKDYANYVRNYLLPFKRKEESLLECIIRIKNLLEVD